MTTVLSKPVERVISVADGSGRRHVMVARFAQEGLYLKYKGERWTSALLLPWSVAYTKAAWLKAERIKRERREKRDAKKRSLT